MKKKCRNCGREFEAAQDYYTLCRDCNFQRNRAGGAPGQPARQAVGPASSAVGSLLLEGYFDSDGNLRRDVILGVPEKLAVSFSGGMKPLGTKQLRDFHLKVQRARNRALMNGIAAARPDLYSLVKEASYQSKRGVVPQDFTRFIEHHAKLAEESEKALDAFFQHIDSIVCFYPKT